MDLIILLWYQRTVRTAKAYSMSVLPNNFSTKRIQTQHDLYVMYSWLITKITRTFEFRKIFFVNPMSRHMLGWICSSWMWVTWCYCLLITTITVMIVRCTGMGGWLVMNCCLCLGLGLGWGSYCRGCRHVGWVQGAFGYGCLLLTTGLLHSRLVLRLETQTVFIIYICCVGHICQSHKILRP